MDFYSELNGDLTAKRKRFCQEYLKDQNATQAAIRAGYSNKTAYSIGSELLHQPLLRKYINHLAQMQRIRINLNCDMVVKELKKIAFAKDGVTTREKLKALEMLGRHIGFFDKTGEIPAALSEQPDTTADIDLTEPGRAVFMLLDRFERDRCFKSIWKGFGSDPHSFEPRTWIEVMEETIGYEGIRESINRRLKSIFVTRKPYP